MTTLLTRCDVPKDMILFHPTKETKGNKKETKETNSLDSKAIHRLIGSLTISRSTNTKIEGPPGPDFNCLSPTQLQSIPIELWFYTTIFGWYPQRLLKRLNDNS